MAFWLFSNMLWAASALLCCTAFGFEPAKAVSTECARVNAAVSEQIARGLLDDAQHSVSEALTHGVGRLEAHRPPDAAPNERGSSADLAASSASVVRVSSIAVCNGLLLDNLAAGLQMSGRLDEAQRFAERAIAYFQESIPTDDPVYLRPLHILATVDLERGKTGRAQEVFRRMKLIRATDPQDRVLLLSIGASLLQRQGRRQEAESQYIGALSAISDAGRQNSADAVSIRAQLASLYLQEHRYRDAATFLDSALIRLSSAADAVPLVRIKLLNAHAVVLADENRWREAEADLAEAVSLCRQQPLIDSAELWPILNNYAHVLRRLHRKQARSIEAWAGALRAANIASRQVIDLTELAPRRDRQP